MTKDTEVSVEALAEAHKLINKAKMQNAHPNGKKGGETDAEGDVVPRKDRANLKNEICRNFVFGPFSRDGTCPRGHESLVQLQEGAKAKRG